ncbi:hypothetical protein Q4610_18105 [Sphingobium sp. HBC34]|uniref:Pesticidal crystal protein N-terminal domain-containing protein n=1 Tax=Sphingobium cyanobacteriorum TaxID=3063954 RepID=A0ABT8ZSM6_9SPHN|nr:hypothetical protein [Sphingobium sp. HBC34]MDO7836964.1 hypothetical protein [Sphingobium sp. HBC34]
MEKMQGIPRHDLTRRHLLAGGVAATFFVSKSLALAQGVETIANSGGDITATEGTPLSVLLETASNHPYVKAATTLLSIAGAINTANWQSQTSDQLAHIIGQLKEINTKLDALTLQVTRLPSIIKRLLEEQYAAQLRLEIKACHVTALNILYKYAHNPEVPVSPSIISDLDRQELNRLCVQVSQSAWKLEAWGDDAFIFLGQAYATLLLIQRAAGIEGVSIAKFRQDIAVEIKQSVEQFSRAFTENTLTYNSTYAQLLPITKGKSLYIGDYALLGKFSIYVRMKGNPAKGYEVARDWGDYPAGNPLKHKTLQSIGPIWQNFKPLLGDEATSKQMKIVANIHVKRLRQYEADAAECRSMELAARDVLAFVMLA